MEDNTQPDDGSVWNPQPHQLEASRSAFIQSVPAESSSSVTQSSTSAVTFASLAPVPAYSQSVYNGHSSHDYHGNSGVRGPYQPGFDIPVSQADVYQPPQSSYERISPVDGYQDVTSGSEAQGYHHTGQSDHSNYGAAQPIDSSTLPQSYQVHQLVVDSANRVVAVQRVISPVDCTVSQSALGLQQQGPSTEPSQNPVLLQPSTSGQHFVPIQVSSMATFAQSEVTTTGGQGSPAMLSQGQVPGEVDVDHTVSSISGSDHVGVSGQRLKSQALDNIVVAGEPDTTQEDDEDREDFHESVHRGYIQGSASLAVREPDMRGEQNTLGASSHSIPSTSNILDSSISSTPQLSSDRLSSSHSQTLQQSLIQPSSSKDVNPQFSTQRAGNLSSTQNTVPSLLTSGMLSAAASANHISGSLLTGIHLPDQMTTSNLSSSQDATMDHSYGGLSKAIVDSSADLQDGLVASGSIAAQGYNLNADDPGLGTSVATMTSAANYTQRRKSSRIAEMESEVPSWQRSMKYDPSQPYNCEELWCDECMMTYETECPFHKLNPTPDKLVFSRAWASLPSMLNIFRLNSNEEDEAELGVYSKRPIPKHTQFGPVVADLVEDQDSLTSTKFPLMVERPDGSVLYYETSDENKCNWMMFVRPAETFMEQNLVAYQHGKDIYFTVSKNIDSRQELKVWYAPHYAHRFGKKVLQITQEDIEVLDQQECKFQCYECQKRFRTAAVLQKHLQEHDEACTSVTGDDVSSPQSSDSYGRQKRKRILQSASLRKKLQSSKKIKDMSTSSDASGSSMGVFHWKKRSTNIYLNKTLKKYQKRHDAEAMRKSMQSLYRKTDGDSGGQEWVCTHCDLTFDNSNLLNLHTLTHAAEDVGLDEIRKFAYTGDDNGLHIQMYSDGMAEGSEVIALEVYKLACPVCHAQFANKKDLIEHASEHGKTKSKAVNPDRPHRCEKCWKGFTSAERLQRHMMVHGDEEAKPLQCHVCNKRFMNNSAMSCHMKTHSANKYYECPICHQGFDQTVAMREHSIIHADGEGLFACPHCDKKFAEFLVLKKHMRGFHTNRFYQCPQCHKVFPRPDKLRLHMLSHSSHREFMCETCGRQFKRKDKLKEHIKRMHSSEREAKDQARAEKGPYKKFVPKVLPTDYHRFIYKCHSCLLGFKRRGMLVNHLAKKHPDIKPDSVPELNLPILKTQRDYYCQYCEKVYKSSSKRKAHILKNHPGADLPLSSRKKATPEELPGINNPTYSQTVGSITTMPHSCEFCHKQYASKAKLTQHQRRKHSLMVPAAPDRIKPAKKDELQSNQEPQPAQEQTTYHVIERYAEDGNAQSTETIQEADLLTQAMSELTQSIQGFRNTTGATPDGTYHLTTRLGHGPPTMVQIQASGGQLQGGHPTIELSHLSQAIQHFNTAQGTVPIQVSMSAVGAQQVQVPIATQAQGTVPQQAQIVTVDQVPQQTVSPQAGAQGQGQTVSIHPVSLVPGGYIPRTWTNYTTFR